MNEEKVGQDGQGDDGDKQNKAELVKADEVAKAQAEFLEAERKRKAALLRLQLAKLEAGEDVDLSEVSMNELERAGDSARGTSLLGGSLTTEGVIGSLGQIGQLMNTMGVEDKTPDVIDPETGEKIPGIKFQRHAGRVKNVKMGRDGKVEHIDFEPEEWPPRNESF